MKPGPLIALAFAVSLGACASGRPTPPVTAAGGSPAAEFGLGWTETGVASWYGEPFHGRRTASGEVYDMDALTAAHQSLPFGTVIRVDNRDNGRSVELRVTDRGPFAKDRILDVSRAGARALGMLGPGTAHVRITVVRRGGDAVSVRGGCVVVQVAAYRDGDAARDRARAVGALGFRVSLEHEDGWHRVIVGPFESVAGARDAVETLDGFVRSCASAASV